MRKATTTSICLALIPAMVVASGCGPAESGLSSPSERRRDYSSMEWRPTISIGILSPSEIHRTFASYKPLADYLTARTEYRFQIIILQTSEDLVGFLEERHTEIAYLGPLDYLDTFEQFGAIPLVKPLNREGQPFSRSVFITRNDTSLHGLSELPGHSLALSSFHSTWGNLIPRLGLKSAGISFQALKSFQNLTEDEEVVQSVLQGRYEAGVAKEEVYRGHADELRPFHVSQPFPSGPFAVRPDLPVPLRQAILGAMLTLEFQGAESRSHWNEEIRYGFVRASDADYDPIRKMIHDIPNGCEGQCHPRVGF